MFALLVISRLVIYKATVKAESKQGPIMCMSTGWVADWLLCSSFGGLDGAIKQSKDRHFDRDKSK